MNARPPWLVAATNLTADGWAHGWTTLAGPDFSADCGSDEHAAAAAHLAAELNLAAGCAWVRQVHGAEVLAADAPGLQGEADALWTDRIGLGVIGRSADCPLILLGARRGDGSPLWGFAHASWRSTVRGVTARLAATLTAAGADPESMQAVICPSAGPCCYEVGTEVRSEALDRLGPQATVFFLPHRDRFLFDLWAANEAQLQSAGVRPDAVERANVCTLCGTGPYPSYRRQGAEAGRFAAVIGRC